MKEIFKVFKAYPFASCDSKHRFEILKRNLDSIQRHVIKYDKVDDCWQNQYIQLPVVLKINCVVYFLLGNFCLLVLSHCFVSSFFSLSSLTLTQLVSLCIFAKSRLAHQDLIVNGFKFYSHRPCLFHRFLQFLVTFLLQSTVKIASLCLFLWLVAKFYPLTHTYKKTFYTLLDKKSLGRIFLTSVKAFFVL